MKTLFLVYLLPLLSSVFLALPFRHSEKLITRLTTVSIGVPFMATLYLLGFQLLSGLFPLELELAVVKISGHHFPFIAWLDEGSFVMLGLTLILGLLVVKFSHGYLHLEKGYQRFFSTILFFIFGMELLSLAGNMDLFFAGWEIVGFSSFLLIAFYRSHSRSVSNALRIYNIYRVCDIGLLLGAVLGHVLWHEATKFSHLRGITPEMLSSGVNQTALVVLGFSIIIASLGKSAQFPFHNWPSRAMEGPTPSSAIFYGALSIHAGVFLLIRTEPLWSHLPLSGIVLASVGLLTLFFSSIQGQVQTNIKGQIAFASTAQIGIMFIELSLGLKELVLIHLFCHALYRCFQLLVSPSVVASSTSLNNRIIFNRIEKRRSFLDLLPTRLRDTLYTLGMTDFSMDVSWRGFGFVPWKPIFRLLKVILGQPVIVLLLLVGAFYGAGLSLALVISLIALFFAARSLWFHAKPFSAVIDLVISVSGGMLAVYLLDPHFVHSIKAYLMPLVPALITLLILGGIFRHYDLRNYQSLGTKHTLAANLFMLSFMVIAGMPISTAFVGEDLLLEELLRHSVLMTGILAGCLMINGLLCAKIYVRLFMGRPRP